jgi:hypothetical protein
MPFWGRQKPQGAEASKTADQGEPSLSHASFRNPDEFRSELATFRTSLVGQRCVPHMVQAEQAFAAQEYPRALTCLQTAKTLYHELHLKILKPDPKGALSSKAELQKLAAVQEKIKSVLASFDRLLAHLEKVVKLNPEKPPAPAATPQRSPELPSGFKEQFLAVPAGTAQLALIDRYFDRKPANCKEDLKTGALYALRQGEQWQVICCGDKDPVSGTIAVKLAITGKAMNPLPQDRLAAAGQKDLLYAIVPKVQTAAAQGSAQVDKGWLTQLIRLVQGTGLVSAEPIAAVRDNAFRLGRYSEALERLEGFAIQFKGAADLRKTSLQKEERAAAPTMSRAKLDEMVARHRVQLEGLNRVQTQFNLLLGSLRAMVAESQTAGES